VGFEGTPPGSLNVHPFFTGGNCFQAAAMLSTHEVERILEHIAPELRDIVLELRNIVASCAPDAAEEFRNKGFIIYDAQRGGPVSAGICQILILHDHIELAFIHGAFLPDPKKLLEGDRLYKKFVRISCFEDAPWDDLKDLLTASFHFDPRSLSN
jgi:hypothetical protein